MCGGVTGKGFRWRLGVGLWINRSHNGAQAGMAVSCSQARHLNLAISLLSQECKCYWPICEGILTIAGGHLQWTSITSCGSSNTPSHFLSQTPEWSTCADGLFGFSVSIGMELTLVPYSQWKQYWDVLILSHNDWRGDYVSSVKQTFHHLSPATFTECVTELLSKGGKGHFLTSTFSKHICNR